MSHNDEVYVPRNDTPTSQLDWNGEGKHLIDIWSSELLDDHRSSLWTTSEIFIFIYIHSETLVIWKLTECIVMQFSCSFVNVTWLYKESKKKVQFSSDLQK